MLLRLVEFVEKQKQQICINITIFLTAKVNLIELRFGIQTNYVATSKFRETLE